MKFTDGFWLLKKGVHAMYPVEAYDAEIEEDRLVVYAVMKKVGKRGDTTDTPLITVELSSPIPDVVRVRCFHFTGGRTKGPGFAIGAADGFHPEVRRDGGRAELVSGKLHAGILLGAPWGLDFLAEGRSLVRSAAKGMGFYEVEAEGPYAVEQLSLGVGECVYGMGERFTPFVRNGQAVDIWNADGGTASEQAYKNVPFYLTNRGYGVFVNHTEKVSFEIASERVARVQFSVPGQSLDYFVIYGPSPKEVIAKYTALTGRPALPPAWSFGLWLSTSFTTFYDEASITEVIQGMADRDIPLHVFHFDTFWMREFRWCDFQWDPRTFPDPAGMLARLKKRGLHVCLWINPYIAQRSALFREAASEGYLLKKPDGGVWQSDLWQAGMGIVDFTNPAARAWFSDKLGSLLDMGVDSFKSDFGERIPTDVVYHDGSDPWKMHNYYSYLYNETVFEAIRAKRGEGEAVVFARSATAGGQRFPVHWGGDCESNFEAMAESLRGGLSLCLSGFGFWSHDIGGFEGTPTADVYKRWIPFGLLSSHSRLHGSDSFRVPWRFDDEAVDVLRAFAKLKCRLMPYIFAKAVESAATGVPLMRAMVLEFPGDPTCAHLDRQYMLGDAILVAPVFSSDGEVEYYLPEGTWTGFLDGRSLRGPRWVREVHGFSSVPLLVRQGSVIPVGERDDRPDYAYAEGVTLHVFTLEDGARVNVPVPSTEGKTAATFEVRRTGTVVSVEKHGDKGSWNALFVDVRRVGSCVGGAVSSTAAGIHVASAAGSRKIEISLE